MFSDHNKIKLEVTKMNISTYLKLNSTFLYNLCVRNHKRNKKNVQVNKNKNSAYWVQWLIPVFPAT
jgi:hypothetical protein